MYGRHADVAAPQVPAPSQTGSVCWFVVPLHVGLPQLVPEPTKWHDVPSMPLQDEPQAPPCGAGQAGCPVFACEPAGSVVQVPAEPKTLQAWQDPPHAVLQQTPSVQWPDAQSVSAEHLPARVCQLTHLCVVVLHVPDVQSLLVEQVV